MSNVKKKDKRLIPKGLYCYSDTRNRKCPYWSIKKGKPYQENGYCAYLKKGDWDLNKETEWIQIHTDKKGRQREGKTKTAYEIGLPMSLLWDQCKECGIKEELPKSYKKRR